MYACTFVKVCEDDEFTRFTRSRTITGLIEGLNEFKRYIHTFINKGKKVPEQRIQQGVSCYQEVSHLHKSKCGSPGCERNTTKGIVKM